MPFTLVRQPLPDGESVSRLLGRTVTFDGVLSADHSDKVDVTEHPVEDSVDVADHVQKKQPTLSLTGMVSNTPLDATALTETGRAVMAYEALLSMLGEEVTVATTVRLYPSMIVTTVGLPRSDPQSLNALSFRVEFRQIKKVAPVFVKFDPSILEDDDDDERAPADSGASETERGAQEESPTEEEEEQAQTVGVQGLDILFNAFGGGDFLGGA